MKFYETIWILEPGAMNRQALVEKSQSDGLGGLLQLPGEMLCTIGTMWLFISPVALGLGLRDRTERPGLELCVCELSPTVVHSFQPHGLLPTRLLCPWSSPGKDTRVGSLSLLQGTFPTQGPSLRHLHLPHSKQILDR